MKKILTSVAMLGLATALFGGSTYAWFSMNREVKAKGMMVKAKVDSSLVIGTSAPASDSTQVDVDFAETEATELYNATSNWTIGTSTGLIYVTNPEDVDPGTGLGKAKGTTPETYETLNYADVSADTGKTHYADYIVYIASLNEPLENMKMTVSLTSGGKTDINGAITADVYMVAFTTGTAPTIVSKDTRKGAINLKNNNSTVDYSGITIPQADGTHYIGITLRVYVDGALEESTTKTYVNTNAASKIADQSLAFSFKASKVS